MIFRNMIVPQNHHPTDHKPQNLSIPPSTIRSSEEFKQKSAQHQEFLFHQQRVARILDRIYIYNNSRFEPNYEGHPSSVISWPNGREMDTTFTSHITSDLDITLLGFSSFQQFYNLSASKRNEFLIEAQNLH